MFSKTDVTFCSLLFLLCFPLSAQPYWQEMVKGVWKTSVGDKQNCTLLSTAGINPKIDAIERLAEVDFPFDQTKIQVKLQDGKTFLRFPLQKNEELYGLGLNFQTHNQRGRVLNLHVDHYGGTDNGRTHAPVPFYVSSMGYGVLIDAANYLTVYAGTGVRVDTDDPPVLKDRNIDKDWQSQPYSDAVEIWVPAGGVEIYIFAGRSMLETVQRYNLYCGGGVLPPKWGLGFTQRVPTLYSADDILREIDEFESHDFPLDFIGVEPGWHSMAYPCTFEWDQSRFPNPAGFIKKLSGKGIRANLWMNPYVSPKSQLYDPVKPYSGTHTVWNGIVPDFTMEQARQLFKKHFNKNHLDLGVSGYKIDEVDGFDNWLWPDVATFPSGTSAQQLRQIYGLLVQKMTSDWFREKNQRTYGLVRGSNAGASALPYVIYNDYYSHRDFITALINSSFLGVLWTPEVRASESAEEWLRRMQSVCFSPMAMLNAWASGTKPWTFPEVEKQVRAVAHLRMQLLPYLYTAFARYQQEGIPPFRAMQLEEEFSIPVETANRISEDNDRSYPHIESTVVKYQYMMGESILVAPMFAGETSRRVALPRGKWYDFYTGDFVGEGNWITVTPGLDQIPLFVKDGGIIPMIGSRNQVPSSDEVMQLEIRKYGHREGFFRLYDDDGITFDYEKGEYSWSIISVQYVGEKWKGNFEIGDRNAFYYSPDVTWKMMTTH